MKKLIIYSILLCNCFVANAQYWAKQHFNVEDGLPDNYTFAVEKFQDEIYIATDGGLVTFDGNNFKTHFKKEIRYPVSLLNYKDSILYIGSWLDGILAKNKQQIDVIYPERINRILKTNQKALIFNVYQRLAMLAFNEKQQIDTIITLDTINRSRRVAIDKASIYISEQKNITEYTWNGEKKQEFPHQLSNVEAMNSIEGFIFYGDLEGNLVWTPKLNPLQITNHHFEKPNKIKRITAYKKRQVLVQLNHRAEHNSLCLLTFDETFSKIIKKEVVLTIKNGISDIFVDKETIYIASYGDGFYKVFPSILKSYNKSDYQIPTPKFSYENNAGHMVFATENISYTLHEKDTFIQQKNPFRLNTIFEFNDQRYFSSHDNLYNEDLQKISESRIDNFVYAVEKDTLFYSKYWFSRFHNNSREDIYCIEFNVKDKKINTGIHFKNGVYLGTQNGVRKFIRNDVNFWERTRDSVLEKSLKQRVIRNIIQYKDQLLIATPYETYTYDGKNVSPVVFTEEDIYINATFVDNKDQIYVGTNKGFWMITDDFQYHFNTKNGTNSNNIYSFYQDTKGIIWIITGNGIMELNPAMVDIRIPPKIEIHTKKITNDHASIFFKSNARNFSQAVLLEYKINDARWKKIDRQQLEMSNLKPGQYTVSFRGKRINSEWSIPETVQFTISPKWYQITVIKIFILGCITSVLLGFLWFRLRLIKRRNETLSNEINKRIFLEHKVENLREEIARDFHDEIGNKIASVIGLSNNLKHSEKLKSPKIDKIATLSKEIYHTAKDFVWSLNPKNNNIESLCKYLRDYGENFFYLFDEIDFLYLEIDIIPIDISYVKSRNIILAYKEILANIIKHSQASTVTLKAYLEDHVFTIQIQDNGIGFDTITSSQGNGLENIKKRMEMIKADMHIKKEDGVFYIFTLDLKEELNDQNK
ncbi:sensor histidine kinase [Kordia jejudonensis]|uniref:sensor histidine kinase n=1 Tax=Kordia jejudonensis TaxID=1348245 RepID=UPI000629C7E3|nr:two-component regulator propeller domain-containing protein [Kordia jejudonensis]